MEDFNINSTSEDKSYNVSNHNYNSDTKVTKDYTDWAKTDLTIDVLTCIIICIGIPLALVAIRGVFSLVRNNHVTPIYVINLLISDLIQLCCMIVQVVKPKDRTTRTIFGCIYYFGQLASVGFMLCIALERFRCSSKTTYVCVVLQVFGHRVAAVVPLQTNHQDLCSGLRRGLGPSSYLSPLFFSRFFFGVHKKIFIIIFAVFILLPVPLFIYFLIGTLKALSAASRVPLDEKQRIVAILVLVIFLYTLLFLPSVIWCFTEEAIDNTLSYVSYTLLKFSPLADLFLYVFMRKGAVDKLLACRMDRNNISRSTARMITHKQLLNMGREGR
ncbi:G-protein coupled receptor 183-like [Trachinotus anak]|uniref:G-protein coupled receptor 183-like n=1 Tax=Trachinotus anak TaxID=443729 RepID=UPI0039F18C14